MNKEKILAKNILNLRNCAIIDIQDYELIIRNSAKLGREIFERDDIISRLQEKLDKIKGEINIVSNVDLSEDNYITFINKLKEIIGE